LKADQDTIYERVKDSDDRPLLKVDDPKARIIELLNERNSKYEKAANEIIKTDGVSVSLIADKISAGL
ncbi:MAG: shikimate kinase, partial [Lachnospiraceae bacterium]|nr:shikimate kinase [Lachnospiraceae bacterium]